MPESLTPEEDDDEFITKAEIIWAQLDSICSAVNTSLTPDLRLPEKEHRRLEEALHELEERVLDKLGRPSPQLSVLDRMIDQYSFVLSGVFTWLKGKAEVPEVRRKRWLRQDLELAEGHHRAFKPLVKVLRNQ